MDTVDHIADITSLSRIIRSVGATRQLHQQYVQGQVKI